MEVTFDIKEIAEAIATKVKLVTGVGCEAFASETGAVVVYRYTNIIARVTPLFGSIYVAPVGGAFHGGPVEISEEAHTVNDLREIGAAIDEAIMRVTSAAVEL